jgi:transcriptional regulator with XRE-family HTH domain
MTTLIDYLEDQLQRRTWRPADLARAAGVPDATISHILKGSRRAGPDVCNAIARALNEPPEKIFRLAGLLPSLPRSVEEEREAVRILRALPPDMRAVAMRLLRSLKPDLPYAAPPSTSDAGQAAGSDAPDPYMEILEQLWDKAPDWKKKDIAAQIRTTVEEYQAEQEEWVADRAEGDSGEVDRSA